jgi:DNA-directed RNA polymerase specialized sigma subunit
MSWISDDKSDQWDPSKLGLEYAVSNFNDSKYIQFKRFVKQYIIYMMTKDYRE